MSHSQTQQPPNSLSDILQYSDLSAHLGISVRTLRRFVSMKKIPHKRIGRKVCFFWPDIEAWLRNGKEAKA